MTTEEKLKMATELAEYMVITAPVTELITLATECMVHKIMQTPDDKVTKTYASFTRETNLH